MDGVTVTCKRQVIGSDPTTGSDIVPAHRPFWLRCAVAIPTVVFRSVARGVVTSRYVLDSLAPVRA